MHDLAQAKNRAEFRERARQVLIVACAYVDRLRSGQIPFDDLVITQRLSRDPREYTHNTLNAIAAKELVGSGVELEPGESIHYVILDAQADAPTDRVRVVEHLDGSLAYDVEKYQELFVRSVATLLAPLGVTPLSLETTLNESRALPLIIPRQLAVPSALPLFEWAQRQDRASVSVRIS